MVFRKELFISLACFFLVIFSQIVSAETLVGPAQLSGKYSFGDGLGVNNDLNLSQDGTFSFKWRGCLGTYDENEGPYTFKDGILILSPKRPNIQKGFQGTPTRFLPINWGDRLYLVSENQVLDFVNKINQGNEPRNNRFGYFYLREGDENKKVDGFPKLSAQWQEFLLKEPISGEVVKKVNRKKGIVNRGKKDGLKVGMELTARDAKDTRFTQLKVIAVEEETAKVETLYKDYKVYKGDIVSTRFY